MMVDDMRTKGVDEKYFGEMLTTHMKKAVMLFKGSKGAQFLFTAKYQNN
jgi:hypothetical protein